MKLPNPELSTSIPFGYGDSMLKRVKFGVGVFCGLFALSAAGAMPPARLAVDRGQLVGIQPVLTAADYATEAKYRQKLDGYFRDAQSKGWLGPRSVVVLPEYVGTWLVAANEWDSVYTQGSVESAMARVILHHLPGFLRAYSGSHGSERIRSAVFRMKGVETAGIYDRVFSSLASTYGVTVVPGSVVLPSPEIRAGKLHVEPNGELYNVSVVYRPDGSPEPRIVFKAFPVPLEALYTIAKPVEELPVFDTPAGRLGVLICADSWYPASYTALKKQRAQLIAVPAYVDEDGAMSRPWGGVFAGPVPSDVDPSDPGKITEGVAWRKYSLPARIKSSGAQAGLIVFLRGGFWDIGSDGQPLVTPPVQSEVSGNMARVLLNLSD